MDSTVYHCYLLLQEYVCEFSNYTFYDIKRSHLSIIPVASIVLSTEYTLQNKWGKEYSSLFILKHKRLKYAKLSRGNSYFEVYSQCNHNKLKDHSMALALYTKDENKNKNTSEAEKQAWK